MKFVSNAGLERVIDLLRPGLKPGYQLDIVSPAYSLFAFAEILGDAAHLAHARLIESPESTDLVMTFQNYVQKEVLSQEVAA